MQKRASTPPHALGRHTCCALISRCLATCAGTSTRGHCFSHTLGAVLAAYSRGHTPSSPPLMPAALASLRKHGWPCDDFAMAECWLLRVPAIGTPALMHCYMGLRRPATRRQSAHYRSTLDAIDCRISPFKHTSRRCERFLDTFFTSPFALWRPAPIRRQAARFHARATDGFPQCTIGRRPRHRQYHLLISAPRYRLASRAPVFIFRSDTAHFSLVTE